MTSTVGPVRSTSYSVALLVVLPKDRSTGLTAVVRKAAAGAAERVPLVAVTNLARTLTRLKELGYWITGLDGESKDTLYDVDLTGPTVLVMGAEGEGIASPCGRTTPLRRGPSCGSRTRRAPAVEQVADNRAGSARGRGY